MKPTPDGRFRRFCVSLEDEPAVRPAWKAAKTTITNDSGEDPA
jgi:hypothetical protein